jgi:hypothetical protein
MFGKDFLSRKSFRRDILRGYLENTLFVFIDLAGKRIFWVYAQYESVNKDANVVY